MQIQTFPHKKSDKKTWDEVFQSPCPVKVESFKTGTVIINLKGTINPHHRRAGIIESRELEVPIMAHWVHHQEKGDFLLDVGLDSSYYIHSNGVLEGTAVDEYQQDRHENIAWHLKTNNINLQMVFLSHLHSDHAAGVRELSKNITYVTGKGEYPEYRPHLHWDFLEGLEELLEIDYSQAQEMPIFGASVDLLGDGSLWAIHTPGHTPGHSSFLANGLEGPVLLTMDAAFIHKNLEMGVAPSDYTWNVEMAQKSLERIIKFLEEYPQVKVLPGHEI